MTPIKTKFVAWWMRSIGIIFLIIGIITFREKMEMEQATNLIPFMWFSGTVIFWLFSHFLFQAKKWAWIGSIILLLISSLGGIVGFLFVLMGCAGAMFCSGSILLFFPVFVFPFFIPFILLILDRKKNYLISDLRGKAATTSLIAGIFAEILIAIKIAIKEIVLPRFELMPGSWVLELLIITISWSIRIFSLIGLGLGILGLKSTKKKFAIAGIILCLIESIFYIESDFPLIP
jgi:hypothetical protein